MSYVRYRPGWTGQGGLPYLTITAEQQGEQLVLRLHGELDVSNSDCLWRAISTAARDRRWRTLVLDLGSLRFTDCSGLSVLVRAHQQLARQDRRLVLTGARPMVRRLLALTRLDTYLEMRVPGAAAGQRADRAGAPGLPTGSGAG